MTAVTLTILVRAAAAAETAPGRAGPTANDPLPRAWRWTRTAQGFGVLVESRGSVERVEVPHGG